MRTARCAPPTPATLIEEAGFQQLATPDNGGVCGQATQSASTNFTLNELVSTTTTLAGSSPKAKQAKLVANVSASTSPSGSVDFFEGDTEIASNVPLVSGSATFVAKGVAPGSHTFTAVFDPGAGSSFEESEATATVSVKTSATVSESFPASVAKGKKAKGTITVAGDGASATGTVKIMKGNKTIASGQLKNGKVTLTLPKLAKGKNTLKAVYGGNGAVAGASKSFSIKQKCRPPRRPVPVPGGPARAPHAARNHTKERE